MKANILATGPSLKNYTPEPGVVVFGVNKIAEFHRVDYLVALDELIYSGDKAWTIVDSGAEKIYSNQTKKDEPICCLDNYERINTFKFDMINIGSCVDAVISSAWWYHSIFTAVCIAHIKGFTDLHLYGADFGKEYHIPCTREELLMGWGNLFTQLKKNGTALTLHNDKSYLAKVLPCG